MLTQVEGRGRHQSGGITVLPKVLNSYAVSVNQATESIPTRKEERFILVRTVPPAILRFAIGRKTNADSDVVESDVVNCCGRDRPPCNVLQFQSLGVARTAYSSTGVPETRDT
jgi:hypothetical protein